MRGTRDELESAIRSTYRSLMESRSRAPSTTGQGVYTAWRQHLPIDLLRAGIPIKVGPSSYYIKRPEWYRLKRDEQPTCKVSSHDIFLLWDAGLVELVCCGDGASDQALWARIPEGRENLEELAKLAAVVRTMITGGNRGLLNLGQQIEHLIRPVLAAGIQFQVDDIGHDGDAVCVEASVRGAGDWERFTVVMAK